MLVLVAESVPVGERKKSPRLGLVAESPCWLSDRWALVPVPATPGPAATSGGTDEDSGVLVHGGSWQLLDVTVDVLVAVPVAVPPTSTCPVELSLVGFYS